MIPGWNKSRQLQEKLEEKNRSLKETRQRVANLRQQAARRDEEIEALRSRLARAGSAGSPISSSGQSVPVFFLTGYVKSGTSWLMRMLDAHPEILCKGEGRFFGRGYSNPDAASSKLQPRSLHGAIAESEYLRAWIEKSVWSRGEDVDEHLAGLTRAAIDYFLARRLAETGKRIVGDKTPFTGLEMIQEIQEIHPDAKLIHIIRDGRDVAVSSMHHAWNLAERESGVYSLPPGEIEKRDAYRADPQAFLESGRAVLAEGQAAGSAKNWAEMVERAMEDGPKLLGEDYAEVRYEDLLESPGVELKRVLKFLEADVSEQTVERCVASASFENWTKGRERGQEDSTAFMRKGIAGDWKNVFTKEDRDAFKEAAGDMLIRLGYEKDHDW